MRLTDLLENKEFEFNVAYRIVNYTPTEKDPDHVTVLYDSSSEDPWPTHLMDKWISAINQDETTGVIDIECY